MVGVDENMKLEGLSILNCVEFLFSEEKAYLGLVSYSCCSKFGGCEDGFNASPLVTKPRNVFTLHPRMSTSTSYFQVLKHFQEIFLLKFTWISIHYFSPECPDSQVFSLCTARQLYYRCCMSSHSAVTPQGQILWVVTEEGVGVSQLCSDVFRTVFYNSSVLTLPVNRFCARRVGLSNES